MFVSDKGRTETEAVDSQFFYLIPISVFCFVKWPPYICFKSDPYLTSAVELVGAQQPENRARVWPLTWEGWVEKGSKKKKEMIIQAIPF